MSKKWITYLIIVLEIALAILFAHRAFKGDEKIATSLASWQSSYFKFDDNAWKIEEDNDIEANTIDLVGPFISLGRGSYSAKVDYSADVDGTIVVNTGADNAYRLSARECVLHAERTTTEIEFETKGNVDNIGIGIFYGGSGSLTVNDISIIRNHNQERRELCIYILLVLAINLIFIKRKWIVENKREILVVVGFAIIASIPVLSYGHGKGHDLEFHLMRIEGIKEELLAGHFPVKMQSAWNYGYGYPVSIYYGDVLLYIPAIMRICGFTLLTVYKIYIFLTNFLTVFIAYICGKRIWKNDITATIFTAGYSFATYRIVCLYVRSALGEYTSMAFFPLIMLALYELYFCEEKNSYAKVNVRGLICLTIGMTAIITSHILSTEMICVVLFIFAVIYWKKTLNKQVLATIVLSGIVTALLSTWFIIPFVDYYKNVSVNINTVVNGVTTIQNEGAYLTQYFAVFKTLFGGAKIDVLSMRSSLTPGLLLMGTMIFTLVLWVNNKVTMQMKKMFVCSIVILFVSSNVFPWNYMAETRIGSLLAQIQFPFRYLGFACLTISVLLCLVINQIDIISTDVAKKAFYSVVCVLLIIQIAFDTSSYANDVVSIYNPQYITDLDGDNIKEYFRADSDFDELSFAVTGDSLNSGILANKKGSDYTFIIKMDDAGEVTLPVMNYKGYKVTDEQGKSYSIVDGKQKEIAVSLPANFAGKLYVNFVEPVSWRIAEIISLLTLICFIVFLVRVTKLKKI